jgi:PAS domain S-box-containing protein
MTEPLDSPVPAVGVPDLLFMVDRTGRILDLKASPRRVLRIPSEQMVGKMVEDFLPAAAAQALNAGLARTLAEGAQPGILFSIPFPEGERNYESFIIPPFGPSAPNDRLAVIVCDITDRMRAEAQLRDTNELLTLHIHNSPIYAFIKKVTAAESIVLQASENYRQMIGIPGSEMVGKNVAELFPAELAAKITADDWTVVSKGEVLQIDEELNGRFYATIKYPIVQGGQTLLGGYSQDITERKRMEETLRESEARARAVNDNLPGGFVYQVDTGADGRQRRVTFASQGVVRLHEITADDMMRDDAAAFYSQVAEEDRPRLADLEARAVATMTPFRAEVCFRLPSGALRWGLVTSAPRRLPNGHLLWDGVEIDITARKLAEEAQQQSEAQYRLLFESAADAIYILDLKGRILAANPAASQQTGYAPAELTAMDIAQVNAPGFSPRVPERMQRLIQDGHLEFETTHRRKDGTLFPIEVKTNLGTWRGQPAAISVIRDVTARKEAEAARQKSEAKYRLLFKSIRDAFVNVDMQGRIQEHNVAYEELTGYSAEELRHLTYLDLTPAKWHAIEAQIVAEQVLPHGFSAVYEKEYRRKDGTLVPIELRTILIRDEAGRPAGMWATVRDVSARKRAEQELSQNRNLLDAVQRLAHIGGWEWDIEQQTMDWTEETYRIHAMPVGEPPAGSPEHIERSLACYDPADRLVIADAFRRCTTEGRSYDLEFPLLRLDGQRIWIRTIASAIKDGDRIVKVVGTIMDVSARKRADQFLRLVLDHIPGGVFWKDRHSVFLGCNQTIAQAANLESPDQIVGKTDYDLPWKKEESDAYVAMDRQVMENDQAQFHIIEPQLQADGKPVWLDTCKIPLRDEQGRVIGILGTFTDITEHMALEQALRDNAGALEQRVLERTAELEASRAELALREERFREMAEGIQEMFWLADVQTQKFLYVSPAFETIWNRPVATVLQNPAIWLENLHADDRARTSQAFLHGMETGQFDPIEFRVVRPDGSVRWVAGHGWGIRDASGQIVRSAGLARDITEHRRLEQEILRIGEDERQRIGRDLHDGLSQALAAIGYHAEALRNQLASQSRPETADVQKLVQLIAKTTDQSRALAQGLLLTDLQRGGLVPALQALASNTQELFGVACRYEGPAQAAMPHAEAASQFYRIAQEAATNAAKHGKGSQVVIRLANARDGVRLSVLDNGRGFDRQTIQSKGMGLDIMRYRASHVGATLSFESAPGGGTALHCLLPRSHSATRKKKP